MLASPIEKGVSIPAHRPTLYGFEHMEVGDSRFVSVGNDWALKVQNRVAASAGHWGKKLAPRRKFKTRVMQDKEGNELLRYWRVE